MNRGARTDHLDTTLDELVDGLLANPPTAVGLAKRVSDASAKSSLAAAQAGTELEGTAQDLLIRTDAFRARLCTVIGDGHDR